MKIILGKNMSFVINHPEKIFPVMLILLNICAAIVYFSCGDVKRGVYWLSAAVLTTCVTI